MDSHRVEIRGATKRYGDFCAVDGISLTVERGEFFTLLGPSGCGKTTLLRMIAGFNGIDEGEIRFSDQIINNVPSHKRDVGMVFQNYAIFPHLSVYDNVAYGLRARHIPSHQIRPRVEKALDMVKILNLKDRKPNELSGGQQQRVALARAFVIEPKVLLMDEPLSNLDAKLRIEMRSAIKKLQRELSITTIYVTHDQQEALSISDRIAVMKDGHIMQMGSPTLIYKKPQNRFVAGFIGTSNFLDCTISVTSGDRADLHIEGFNEDISVKLERPYMGKGCVSIRPEHLHIVECADRQKSGTIATVTLSTFLGDYIEYEIELASGMTMQVNAYMNDTMDIIPDGARVLVTVDESTIRVFPSDADDSEAVSC